MNCIEVVVLFCLIGATVANVVPSQNKTACQEHRQRELKLTVGAKLVPKCDENGDYVPLVCFDGENGSKFCTCFTNKGEIAKPPTENVKRCECYLAQHEARNPSRFGAFEPKCEDDGSYKKLQCHGSTGACWC
ncbi:hypothetical protein B4U80_02664, partial [Leptotrombidium deliense]